MPSVVLEAATALSSVSFFLTPCIFIIFTYMLNKTDMMSVCSSKDHTVREALRHRAAKAFQQLAVESSVRKSSLTTPR